MNGRREYQTAAEARKPHYRCKKCAHFQKSADFRGVPKCAVDDWHKCPLATVRAVGMQFYAAMRDRAHQDPICQLAAACVGMAALDMTEPRGNRSVKDCDRQAARWFLHNLGPWGALLAEGAGIDPDYVRARGRAYLASVDEMKARETKPVEVLR